MASLVWTLLAGAVWECWSCVAGIGRWVLRRLVLVWEARVGDLLG